MALNIMTPSMTLSIMILRVTALSIMTLSIMTLSIAKKCETQHKEHNVTTSKFRISVVYAECHIFDIVMLSVVMLNVITLSVVSPHFAWHAMNK